jgi:hypothetical protein
MDAFSAGQGGSMMDRYDVTIATWHDGDVRVIRIPFALSHEDAEDRAMAQVGKQYVLYAKAEYVWS